MQGRYVALYELSWGLAGALGPAQFGITFDISPGIAMASDERGCCGHDGPASDRGNPAACSGEQSGPRRTRGMGRRSTGTLKLFSQAVSGNRFSTPGVSGPSFVG